MTEEMEIRLAARADDLRRLSEDAALLEFRAGPPAKRHLTTLYYDTPGLHLAKAGLILRVRDADGVHVQAVKTANSGEFAFRRKEFESEIACSKPDITAVTDSDLRERIRAIADDVPLVAVLETDIERTVRAIHTNKGDEVELAVDRGEIRTPNGRVALPVHEVELELKHGSPLALYDIARALSRQVPLVVRMESKSERGFRAAQGREPQPEKAGRARLAADCTAEEAFRATLRHCLHHLARNAAVIAEARNPEAVHQMRVGLRRLRAALSAFGKAFRVPAIEELRARAKTLAGVFGDTRELDVFASDLLPPVEAVATDKPGLAALRVALDELRHGSWDRTVQLVQSDALTGFLLDLGEAAEARIWRASAPADEFDAFLKPAAAVAVTGLDKALARAKRRAKHLARQNAQERHRLRIALKRLRYSAEFFAPLFEEKAVSPFLKSLSKLQDLFGALNDIATEEAVLKRVLEQAGERADASVHAAAAFLDGWHQSRFAPTWKKAKKRWKTFAKTEPFWTKR